MNALTRGLNISRAPIQYFGNRVPGLWANPRHRIAHHTRHHQRKQYRVYTDQSGMDEERENLVKDIHATETQLVLYVTGGAAHVCCSISCLI